MHGVQNTEKRLLHSNKGRCANIRLRSEAKHCSSLCSQSEGGEYCGGQARAKNPTKICPRALAIFATCSWPSLCKQSELQCWRRRVRYKVPPPSGESYAGYSALKGWMFKIPQKTLRGFEPNSMAVAVLPLKGAHIPG